MIGLQEAYGANSQAARKQGLLVRNVAHSLRSCDWRSLPRVMVQRMRTSVNRCQHHIIPVSHHVIPASLPSFPRRRESPRPVSGRRIHGNTRKVTGCIRRMVGGWRVQIPAYAGMTEERWGRGWECWERRE